jgi:ATP-dependent RNA helicase RhlE
VDVSTGQVAAVTVTHQVHHVAVDRKREVLSDILMEHSKGAALVFCRTKRGANRVGEDLERRGVRAGVIHGNKSQNARTRALDDFKAGRLRVLVATDIAARGLDIAHLPLVVNFDLPLVAEDYVHRIGRTGRAGQTGRAVSLVSASDDKLLRDIQRLVAAPIERVTGSIGHASSEPAMQPVARRANRGGMRDTARRFGRTPSGPRRAMADSSQQGAPRQRSRV